MLALAPPSSKGFLKWFGLVGASSIGIALGIYLLGLNPLPFGVQVLPRTAFVLFTWIFLIVWSLPALRSSLWTAVLVLPSLQQSYNLALYRDFPAGGNSIFRLLPALVGCFWLFLLVKGEWKDRLKSRWWIVLFFIFVGLTGLISGWNGSWQGMELGFGLFYLILFPLLALAIPSSPTSNERHYILLGATLSFFILSVASLVTVYLGASMMDSSDSLLGTRGFSEFNLTMAYLILLWPLTYIFLRDQHWSYTAGTILLLLIVFVVGLSRVGIAISFGLVLLTLAVESFDRKRLTNIALTLVASLALTVAFVPQVQNVVQDVSKRFNVTTLNELLDLGEVLSESRRDFQVRDSLRAEGALLAKYSPVFGQGVGSYSELSRVGYRDAHSLFFTWIAEHGILSTLGLYALISVMIWRLIGWTKSHPGSKRIGVLALAAIVAWLASVHSTGGGIVTLSADSFNITAAGGMFLLLYLVPGAWLRSAKSEEK